VTLDLIKGQSMVTGEGGPMAMRETCRWQALVFGTLVLVASYERENRRFIGGDVVGYS